MPAREQCGWAWGVAVEERRSAGILVTLQVVEFSDAGGGGVKESLIFGRMELP
jgi:hypothetical protein